MSYGPQHGSGKKGGAATAENPGDRAESQARQRTAPPEGLPTEELILRTIRHDDDVSVEQVLERLLEVLDSLPENERAAAIVTAGREMRWAELSGDCTPESEYPEILDARKDPEPSDRKKLAARISIAIGKAGLTDAKGEALAQIFLTEVVNETKNREDRRNALALTVSLFTNMKPDLPEGENEPMSEDEFRMVVFKNRRVLEQLEAILKPNAFETTSGMGKAIFAALGIKVPVECSTALAVAIRKAIGSQGAKSMPSILDAILGGSTEDSIKFVGPEGPLDLDGLLEQLAQAGHGEPGQSWHPRG